MVVGERLPVLLTRILHLLSQRPSLTGSGITIEALVRGAAERGYEQHAVCGIPHDEARPQLAGLPQARIHPLRFGSGRLDFPVPGMSDVMPYESTVFSSLSDAQWGLYRSVWSDHLARVIDEAKPDLVHSHHIWLMSALVRDLAPELPLVVHSHATGLRQMQLCPDRAPEVLEGCRRADHFCALHEEQARTVRDTLKVERERVTAVGAGYREELFSGDAGESKALAIAYVGKLSASKGVPSLLNAFERLHDRNPEVRLHLFGGGGGDEGQRILDRARSLRGVTAHGFVSQQDLVAPLRRCSVFCLPSFYEGLPLVLVEAAATGCRLVATRLSGIVEELAPHLGDQLDVVPLPRLRASDQPLAEDLPAFEEALERALERALRLPPLEPDPARLEAFTWSAVFARVEAIWASLLG